VPAYTCILLTLAVLLSGCTDPGVRAEQEAAAGHLPEAAKLFWQAAADSSCPERGLYLLRRADIQREAGYIDISEATVDQVISSCPSLPNGYWARAKNRLAQGNREQALADAKIAKESIPEALEFFDHISRELEAERAIQERDQQLILALSSSLDPNKAPQALRGKEPAALARQVPLPLALRYQVKQQVLRPKRFSLAWEELISYRGDRTQPQHDIVQRIELPPMDPRLPLYHRLQLANRRLPMIFKVGARGEVLQAHWRREGPNRGIRPEVLKPEIEATLKRRRLYDPGERGERSPGDRWGGEMLRIIDGKPLPLSYRSHALGWVETSGIRTLHIRSRLEGAGYQGEEERWLHPSTAVDVRWRLKATFSVETPTDTVTWSEIVEAYLTSAAGAD